MLFEHFTTDVRDRFDMTRTSGLLSKRVDEASPERRWCLVSQSPCDDGDAEPVPPWDRFSQGGAAGAPPPGPVLAALTGAVANLGQLDGGQLLGAGSAAR